MQNCTKTKDAVLDLFNLWHIQGVCGQHFSCVCISTGSRFSLHKTQKSLSALGKYSAGTCIIARLTWPALLLSQCAAMFVAFLLSRSHLSVKPRGSAQLETPSILKADNPVLQKLCVVSICLNCPLGKQRSRGCRVDVCFAMVSQKAPFAFSRVAKSNTWI